MQSGGYHSGLWTSDAPTSSDSDSVSMSQPQFHHPLPSAVAANDWMAAAGGRAPPKKRAEPPRCQVAGCCADLTAERKAYCIKKRICSRHMQADVLTMPGTPQALRFCFQCSKIEPLSLFDGTKRSCRVSLARRQLRPCGTPPLSAGSSDDSGAAAAAAHELAAMMQERHQLLLAQQHQHQHQQLLLAQQQQAAFMGLYSASGPEGGAAAGARMSGGAAAAPPAAGLAYDCMARAASFDADMWCQLSDPADPSDAEAPADTHCGGADAWGAASTGSRALQQAQTGGSACSAGSSGLAGSPSGGSWVPPTLGSPAAAAAAAAAADDDDLLPAAGGSTDDLCALLQGWQDGCDAELTQTQTQTQTLAARAPLPPCGAPQQPGCVTAAAGGGHQQQQLVQLQATAAGLLADLRTASAPVLRRAPTHMGAGSIGSHRQACKAATPGMLPPGGAPALRAPSAPQLHALPAGLQQAAQQLDAMEAELRLMFNRLTALRNSFVHSCAPARGARAPAAERTG